MGIGRHDRIAIALPNGPEAAMAILAVAASAACAPMNPAYRTEEVARYFADLRPRALITQAGMDTPARRAALVEACASSSWRPQRTRRPVFSRLAASQRQARSDESVSPGDIALLLSRQAQPRGQRSSRRRTPRCVPRLTRSVAALALTETDRCLNMHAPVSRPWSHYHADGLAVGRRQRRVHPRTRRQPLLRMAHQISTNVVLRGADHASGHSRPSSAQSRATGGLPASLRPLRRPLRCRPASSPSWSAPSSPCDRVVRHDGNRFIADRVQSAAAAPAQARFGRHTGGFGRRDHGRRRGFAARRSDRTGRRSRRKRHGRLRWRPEWRPMPRLQAIGSRPGILASSMTTGTCFSRAASGR